MAKERGGACATVWAMTDTAKSWAPIWMKQLAAAAIKVTLRKWNSLMDSFDECRSGSRVIPIVLRCSPRSASSSSPSMCVGAVGKLEQAAAICEPYNNHKLYVAARAAATQSVNPNVCSRLYLNVAFLVVELRRNEIVGAMQRRE